MNVIASHNLQPLVTAVITTYDRVELLKRAVKSVFLQDYQHIELIVVDDASANDNASNMLRQLNDERARIIKHDVNKGVSAARNTGIRHARGKYVAFLDDDDIWLEDKISKQIDLINGTHADAVLTAYYVIKNNDYYYVQKESQNRINRSDLKRGSRYGCSGMLVLRDYAEQLLFDEEIGHGEDWDFIIRLSKLTTVYYIDQPMFILNDGGHQRITNRVKQNFSITEIQKRLKQLDKHTDFFGKYWRKYHEVCLYFGYISSMENKYRHIIYVAHLKGLTVTLHVLSAKVIKNIRIGISKKKITQGSRFYQI